MLDLLTVDPATLQAGPELNALIAEWTGLEWRFEGGQPDRSFVRDTDSPWRLFEPSTNPAHAGEARRKETYHKINHGRWEVCVEIGGKTQTSGYAEVAYIETNGDKGKAEALATCRAIVAAMQAAEQENQTDEH